MDRAGISRILVWERGGLHVRYAIALIGQERFGHFSIEILEAQALEAFIEAAFA
ncbi:hypothetical protein NWV16_12100 [Pseudomonas sp. BW7P1]|nr:hypothetical protein [Pseudomonas sp. BW7P1]UWI64572.1 hypothetical protein NWV16_12100 [Pseudomonas sp. BW7P1]